MSKYIDRVYIEGASSTCLNARPPCTDADDLLRLSATVGNLGERGEPDILTKVRHWDLLEVVKHPFIHSILAKYVYMKL